MMRNKGIESIAGRNVKRIALAISSLSIVFVANAQSTAGDPVLVEKDGIGKTRPPAIVIVHTEDRIGKLGLATAKSCASGKIILSEERALAGVHSTILAIRYDSAGKIVGVHYGVDDLCSFVQQATKQSSL